MFDPRLEPLKPQLSAYWAARALYQLEYAREVSKAAAGQYDAPIEQAIQALVQANESEGAITKSAALQLEALLAPLASAAKAYTVLCVSHAHIDMNWMWRWDETVSITLDTFRTMLDLMREYPAFTFSQSQASVYQIVEHYDPEMLAEIRQRVQEGRWEVAASTWVEADKNLPNGESAARHLLYTRRYLSQLLGLKADQFPLDFEPDTFGHHANVPEILADGGVKYYYHCRGDQGDNLYRWDAPSGRSILVYREPTWYLGYIEPTLALYAPAFCQKYGLDTILKVYGVGDHGGGPTRRDVERIQDMAAWPIFPVIRFGTYAEYFAKAEAALPRLPVVSGELNFVFTGCYTSQSRIKRANRLSEAALFTSEAFSAIAALRGAGYPAEKFAAAWQNTLFNQFHDIIPGSGVIDTREYARGLFQQTLAIASSQKSRAFRALAVQENAPAKALQGSLPLSDAISEGAGVGFGVEDFRLAQVSRGGGLKRLFQVFNPSPRERRETVELVVWDWQGDLQRLQVKDENGYTLRHQALDAGWNNYWGHHYLRLLVEASFPACGYATLVLSQSAGLLDSAVFPTDPRVEEPPLIRLENEHLQAAFDSHSCALVSLRDKATGLELLPPGQPAAFRRILEEDQQGMTAWVVGRYMNVQPLVENVHLLKQQSGPLRQSFTCELAFGASKLTLTVRLDAGSRRLEYDADCDWHEVGRRGQGVPQLNFALPLAQPAGAYSYDIPFGVIQRAAREQDVPANSWAAALPDGQSPAVQLISEGSYGFRADAGYLALTLIRSSFDPDPYPEFGPHKLRFAVAVLPSAAAPALITAAEEYTHPLEVLSAPAGTPIRQSYLSLESPSAVLSALKAPEDGQPGVLVLRLYESAGQPAPVTLRFAQPIASAAWADVHELPVPALSALTVDGPTLTFSLPPHRLATLRVTFAA